MNARTLDSWLLVNYAGYPYTPSCLLPDNGLANLAGVLVRDGRRVKILDYATASVFSRFTPPVTSARLLRTWEKICAAKSKPLSVWDRLGMMASLHRGERSRRHQQRRVLAQLGQELIETIRQNGIDAVGFKLWNGDGVVGSVELARMIRREFPGIRIFGGGPQVDMFLERILDHYDVFDAVVYGEGEESIARLAASGANPDSFETIPNLIYRRDGRTIRTEHRIVASLDELPKAIYDPDVYPAMKGDEKIRIIVIDESRGCRNHCAFCIHPAKSDHKLRIKSIPRLMEEIRNLERYGISAFRFAGSCTPYSLLEDVAVALKREDRKVRYTSFAHVRGSDKADFKALKESGCLALFFGVESGSQPILDAMRKGTRVETARAGLTAAREAGVMTIAGLIHPAPGETESSARETLEFMKAVNPSGAAVTPPTVMPRTAWIDDPHAFGIEVDHERYLAEAIDWKVKMLMPPTFWSKLPFTIDGKSHGQILKETMAFTNEIERAGIATAITDESCLMSAACGMPIDEFRQASRMAFFAGHGQRAGELVRAINAGVQQG